MQSNIWKKGLGLGIILLFLGVCILPTVNRKLLDITTEKENIKTSTKLY